VFKRAHYWNYLEPLESRPHLLYFFFFKVHFIDMLETETETVSETLDCNSLFTRLIAREDF
jgi:hypothetical protein